MLKCEIGFRCAIVGIFRADMFECCQQRHPLSARLQTLGQQGRKPPPVPPRQAAGRGCATRSASGLSGLSCRRSCRIRRSDGGNGYDGAYGCPGYGLPDKLGLAHVVSRKPFRKLGVFFLGHACLDYPAAVRRVISFSHGKTSFGCAWCPLTNRRKTGCKAELFLKNPKNYFEGFFSGASRISRVWGRHSPTRFPQGQNER